ncbi:MAG TPA: sugar transferase [Bacteroidales bacterium]|nr:sugar transferase [Bacteroidales bacterium]
MLYKSIIKPILDFLFSLLALLILSPLFLVITFLLAIANSGNPFFIQTRPGKNARLFRLIKFKTMTDHRDAYGNLLPDAERLTTVGKFIRKTSLDEIPQLINVLKGDMSLIGPRPLLVEYLPLYNKEQARRHELRPGITGWAQINGRNAISWEQKFKYDLYYVDNCSLVLDLIILIKTIEKVFASEGISQQGQATAEKFTGSN